MTRKALSVMLLLSGMLFVGCGRDQAGISRVTAPVEVRPGSTQILSVIDELDYQSFSGTLYPGESGVLSGTMTTWGGYKNCTFSVVVPESSMPQEGPINFTMSIPTKASLDAHPELYQRMIIRLDPDGQQFLGPITVQGTWMPWQGQPPAPVITYCPGDTTQTAQPTVVYVPSINRYRVTFQVLHFSDWETGPEPKRNDP